MNNEPAQLELNFPIEPEVSREQIVPQPLSPAPNATVVNLSCFRDQRAQQKQIEDEHDLMAWIRARVEHLQA
nr:hypothetical protein [Alcaligenes faecalis]